MAFEGLSERLQKAFSGLRRKGKVTDADAARQCVRFA